MKFLHQGFDSYCRHTERQTNRQTYVLEIIYHAASRMIENIKNTFIQPNSTQAEPWKDLTMSVSEVNKVEVEVWTIIIIYLPRTHTTQRARRTNSIWQVRQG